MGLLIPYCPFSKQCLTSKPWYCLVLGRGRGRGRVCYTYPSFEATWRTANPLDLLSVKMRRPRWSRGILSRLYFTTASLFSFSLTSKLRGVVLGSECTSVSSFSFKMLLRGEVVGGDWASVLSAHLEDMDDERVVLFESIFIGVDSIVFGWQINASPSSEIQLQRKHYKSKETITVNLR